LRKTRYAAGLREVSDAAFKTRSEHFLGLLDLARFKERLAGRLSGDEAETCPVLCAINRKYCCWMNTTVWIRLAPRVLGQAQLAATEGMTTVVATPYLDEAERCSYCSDV